MSESSKYHSFTVADIERYHSGQMPPAERHALEKAALEDPFLADALEGYAFTTAPVADVNALKNRLEEKLKRRKTVSLISLNARWTQIAALFLLLAGSGWMVYHFDLFNKKEIAMTPSSQKEAVGTSSSQPLTDSTAPHAVTTVKTEQKEVARPQNNLSKRLVKHSTKPKKTVRSTTVDNHPTQSKAIASLPTIENKEIQRQESRNPRLLAQTADSNNGYFSAFSQTKRNVTPVPVNRPAVGIVDSNTAFTGRVSGVKVVPDTTHLNVVLQESKEGLNEVVVTGYAKKKEVPLQNPKFGELEPAQGWSNFDAYIAENLKEPAEVKEKTVSGDVELSFDVNKEGEAVNIKVEKSLCSKCDEEAIRLLKGGPKWKKKKNKKGKITIHF